MQVRGEGVVETPTRRVGRSSAGAVVAIDLGEIVRLLGASPFTFELNAERTEEPREGGRRDAVEQVDLVVVAVVVQDGSVERERMLSTPNPGSVEAPIWPHVFGWRTLPGGGTAQKMWRKGTC